jgi:ectoine hydroxylase-related dioxygenase (phytanoyl-CoA dioxygenase family)
MKLTGRETALLSAGPEELAAMDTKEALASLGVDEATLTAQQKRDLDERGFFVVPDAFTPAQCAAMGAEFDRLSALEAGKGGHEVHVEPGAPRLSNIFNKTDAFDICLACRPILAAAQHLLGEIKLHGANIRDPLKGQGHQILHCDVPKHFEGDWWLINTIIMFDEMTEENGPTRLVPGSHKWPPLNVPDVNLGDYKVKKQDRSVFAGYPEDSYAPYPGEFHLTGRPGTVAVMNAHTWHGGTLSRSGARRRVLHLSYTRRELPQQLVQREHLTPFLYDRMNAAQRFLLDIEGPRPAEVRRQEKAVKTWAVAQPEEAEAERR